ncbi:MAG: hypothetical protein AAGE61_17150 [Pseudomonadota bacterium]
MSDSQSTPGKLAENLSMSEEQIALMGEVFARGTEKLGIDGRKIFEKISESGSVAGALGVSDAMVENLYASAHRQFVIGQLDRAEQLFRALCSLAPKGVDHWLGYGICLRARGLQEAALGAFGTAAKVAPDAAVPHFHRLEILIRTEDWEAAKEALSHFDIKASDAEKEKLSDALEPFRTALSMRKNG